MYLQNKHIKELRDRKENPLIIRPLLEVKQIGEISIDLRLGTDFLVSIHNRHTTISATKNAENIDKIPSFFQETRRRPGETFLLHPNQTVLATTLEYFKMPTDHGMEIKVRNSYSRIGLRHNTTVHPGYTGVICIELINSGKHIIELTVGAKIFAAFIFKASAESNYFHENRKYMCSVRPEISAILEDKEFDVLHEYHKFINNNSESDGDNNVVEHT